MKLKTISFFGLLITILCTFVITINANSENLKSQNSPAPTIWPEVTPGAFSVGFMVMQEYDNTRTFKPKYDYFGKPTQGPVARPLQISIWYPAKESINPKYMRLVEYYQTSATETEFTPPTSEQLKFVVERLKQIWPIEFRVPPEGREEIKKRIDEALQKEVFAVRDAIPAEGSFPLIVHMPGYNGSPDGCAYLFEFLASRGYVVAAVPNMGMYRRNIDDEAASLDVQARDLEFVVGRLSNLSFVDGSRIGTTGMSWGGMSNVLFAERNYLVDAILTLDGAITMPEELKLIEAVPGYAHRNLRAAYMQLLVAPAEAKFRPKDLHFYDSLVFCDAYMIQFRGVDHDEFSCGYLRLRNLRETDPSRITYLERFSREIYSSALRFFDAYLKKDSVTIQSLTDYFEKPVGLNAEDTMIVLKDFKKAKRRPLTRSEFVDIIKTQGADVASKVYKDYCKIQPQNNLVVSDVIGPLYMDEFECGNFKEALAICELWETGLPSEPGPLFSKARIYTKTGEIDKAISCYERILTIVKEGRSAETARERLQELRSKPKSEASIKIRWLGHSSFLVTTSDGTTILTDPVDFKGYHIPPGTTADVVTVSHEHVDHNCIKAVSGSPIIFHGTDESCRNVNSIDTTIGDIRIYTEPSFHDPGHRGSNAIFIFEFNGIRMAHLGDIGTVLTNDQIDAIGEIDILMVPVGGQYTIAGAQADSIVNLLNVKHLVLPMHYKTEAFEDLPYGVEPFLKGKENVRRVDDSVLTFNQSELKAMREYVVMRY